MTKTPATKNKYQRALIIVGGLLVFAVLLAIDLITKAWAEASDIKTNYFLGIVSLNFERNYGIAFSIADGNPTLMKVITAVTGVLIVGIAVLYFTLFMHNPSAKMCLAVIDAGGVGNFIDRLSLSYVLGHYVRDFIDLEPIHLGVCNIADFCIVLGAIALVFIILFIGPHAVFPLTKKWREEAKREDGEKAKKHGSEP